MAPLPSCVRKECPHPSDKELNLQAVVFRTYEESLTRPILKSATHIDFLDSVGLTDFIKLDWTHVHKDLAIEFLKNYRKKKKKSSSSTCLTSTVRGKKLVLNKRLIASTFKISSKGYKYKDFILPSQENVSSLFDPSMAKRKGYRIRDCKDPVFFERLEALNRLMNFQPPGHLVSATLVDMIIHAGIQHVDWASLLLVSLMKELDRVTCSLHQSPSTHAGVHILLILTSHNIVTSQDRTVLERTPFVLLDGYSTANAVAPPSLGASPAASDFTSPRKTVRFREHLESRHSSRLSRFPFVGRIWSCLKRCFPSGKDCVTKRISRCFQSAKDCVTMRISRCFRPATDCITKRISRCFRPATDCITKRISRCFRCPTECITRPISRCSRSSTECITRPISRCFRSPTECITTSLSRCFRSSKERIITPISRCFRSSTECLTRPISRCFRNAMDCVTTRIFRKRAKPAEVSAASDRVTSK